VGAATRVPASAVPCDSWPIAVSLLVRAGVQRLGASPEQGAEATILRGGARLAMSRDQRISKDGERAKGARTRSIYMLRWHAIACFVALHFAVSLAGTAHEAAPQAPSATAQAQEVHSVAGGSATTSPKTTRLADGSTSDVGQKVEFKKRKVGQRNITIVHEQIGERWHLLPASRPGPGDTDLPR